MSSFLVILLCLLLKSVASSLTFNCSQSHACLGDVIRCQCQDDQTRLLIWRVREADVEFRMSTNSSVEIPTTMNGLYSATLNSTNPFSSQLTITLMTQETNLTVECTTASSKLGATIYIIGAPSGQPINLQVRVINPVQNTSDITVMLWWDSSMSATNVIEYRINITVLVTGLTQQLSSTNTSVTTQLNTAGEYLVQVVAVNCAGTSQRSAIRFNLTEKCLGIRDCSQQQTTATDSATPFGTTIVSQKTGGNEVTSTVIPPPAANSAEGCVENWHIGIAVACIVIIQIVSTTICVTTVILKNKRAKKDVHAVVMEMSPGHSEHVQSEQQDPCMKTSNLKLKTKRVAVN